MNKIRFFKMILFLIFPGLLFGHGPTRQKVSESVIINGEAGNAWSLISNLAKIGDWHSQYKSIKSKGEDLQPVSMFAGGPGVIQILALDPEKKLLKYRLKKPGIIPVNNYSGRLRVEQIDSDKIKITYKGAFYRKYLNNDPPPEENDDAAIAAVSKMYIETLNKFGKQISRK